MRGLWDVPDCSRLHTIPLILYRYRHQYACSAVRWCSPSQRMLPSSTTRRTLICDIWLHLVDFTLQRLWEKQSIRTKAVVIDRTHQLTTSNMLHPLQSNIPLQTVLEYELLAFSTNHLWILPTSRDDMQDRVGFFEARNKSTVEIIWKGRKKGWKLQFLNDIVRNEKGLLGSEKNWCSRALRQWTRRILQIEVVKLIHEHIVHSSVIELSFAKHPSSCFFLLLTILFLERCKLRSGLDFPWNRHK